MESAPKNVLNVVLLILLKLLKSTSRLSWNRRVTVCYEDSGRKPVWTYSISVCEALVSSVNSVKKLQFVASALWTVFADCHLPINEYLIGLDWNSKLEFTTIK